jgi:hypothetical protein
MRWWGGDAERGDARRLEAFSDGVLAIAITLLILDVHVEQVPGESLAEALAHALPEIVAYSASFLQIGIMWANHHSLFRVVDRSTSCCCWPTWYYSAACRSCRCPPGWSPSTPRAPTRAPQCCSTAPR